MAVLAASVAGLVLLMTAAFAVVPPQGRAAERMTVAVVGLDGRCTLRVADPDSLARIDGALAEQAARLRGMAERLMADAAAARLAGAREQVPAFGAWAYDWVQSYITSYRVLGRLARGLAESVQRGEGTGALSERIMDEISSPMREEFRRRVLAPDLAEGLLADLVHTATLVDSGWQAGLRLAAAELAALPRANGGPADARVDLPAAARSLAVELEALAPRNTLAVVTDGTSSTTSIFMRSMRPMAARLGAVVVRASEAGSLIATAGAFGYVVGGVPGVVIGATSGAGVSWAIDWGLNRFDAALNRAEFERQALVALEAAERRIAERTGSIAGQALDDRRAVLRPAALGCGRA